MPSLSFAHKIRHRKLIVNRRNIGKLCGQEMECAEVSLLDYKRGMIDAPSWKHKTVVLQRLDRDQKGQLAGCLYEQEPITKSPLASLILTIHPLI